MSAVPALLTALVNKLTAALPNAEVGYGRGISQSEQMVRVGCSDYFADGPQEVAQADQTWLTEGLSRQETVSIRCVALAWSGDVDIPTVLQTAYSLFAQVEAALVADETFGGTTTFSTGLSHVPEVDESTKGTAVQIRFDVNATTFLP